MNVQLGQLKVGQWRDLNKKEMDQILRDIKNSSGTEEASK